MVITVGSAVGNGSLVVMAVGDGGTNVAVGEGGSTVLVTVGGGKVGVTLGGTAVLVGGRAVLVGGTTVLVAVGGTTVSVAVGWVVSVGSAVGVSEGSGVKVAVSVGRGVPEGRTPVKVAVASGVLLGVPDADTVATASVAVGDWGSDGSGVGRGGNAELLLSNRKPMAYNGKVRMRMPKYSPRRWGLKRELRFMGWGGDSRIPSMPAAPLISRRDPIINC
jgi:hypothetical protein